jgi:hypothetical protein
MSGPAQTSLHEPKSDTCDTSPIHNDCRKAEPGGSPAQSQHPRRSTNRPACQQPSRTADAIEQSMFGRGGLQLFDFTARLEQKPAFPSRWGGPGSTVGGATGTARSIRALYECRPSIPYLSLAMDQQREGIGSRMFSTSPARLQVRQQDVSTIQYLSETGHRAQRSYCGS